MTLLVAIALCLQDMTAEETFKKIEENIRKAKTVSLKFTLDVLGNGEGREIMWNNLGTILLKEGNKAWISERTITNGREMTKRIISDGSRLRMWSPGLGEVKDEKTPSYFGQQIASAFIRGGSEYLGFGLVGESVRKEESQIQELMGVSEVKKGGDENLSKSITYLLGPPGAKGLIQVQLWYDPNTFEPIKRTTVLKSARGKKSTSEIYHEFTLNADIPDEKFKLPEK